VRFPSFILKTGMSSHRSICDLMSDNNLAHAEKCSHAQVRQTSSLFYILVNLLPIMPYNTTAIPPRKEPTGQNQLPRELLTEPYPFGSQNELTPPFTVSRVKKIISQDPEVALCSNNAAFVITLATVRYSMVLSCLLLSSLMYLVLTVENRKCLSSTSQKNHSSKPRWSGNHGETSNTKTLVCSHPI
jgi:hypothetical protein